MNIRDVLMPGVMGAELPGMEMDLQVDLKNGGLLLSGHRLDGSDRRSTTLFTKQELADNELIKTQFGPRTVKFASQYKET